MFQPCNSHYFKNKSKTIQPTWLLFQLLAKELVSFGDCTCSTILPLSLYFTHSDKRCQQKSEETHCHSTLQVKFSCLSCIVFVVLKLSLAFLTWMWFLLNESHYISYALSLLAIMIVKAPEYLLKYNITHVYLLNEIPN